MKVAVAGIPGAWSSERLAEALRGEGVETHVFSLGEMSHDIAGGTVAWRGTPLRGLDAVVVKKLGDQASPWNRLRLHALRALEHDGVRVFSPSESIERAMDRYWMTLLLAEAGLPVPRTLAVGANMLPLALAAVGDAVVKPVYTSKGRGMVRVRAGGTAPGIVEERSLVQQFVAAPGRDIGAAVVGGRFVGAFYRIAADGEWITTTDRGGRYAPCDLSPRGVAYAERAAALFALDYTVVDLVEQDDDFLLYEVSAFGGFRGLLEATGVDASLAYARHVVRTLAAG
ncbi:MAG: ATP-grasp domain-containing protein [Dehalococcoidia bacterium]